jgi:hypothetical protein
MATVVRKIAWQWDRAGRNLWANITTNNGQLVRVGFPLGQVALTFDEELGRCGIVEPAQVGDYESVDGFLSRVRRVAKRAVKRVKQAPHAYTRAATRGFVPRAVFRRVAPKALQRTQRRLERAAISAQRRAERTGKKYGMAAARSKTLGAGLGAAAVAFPAVGGPALGAWTAANRAVKIYDQAQAARQAIQRGVRNPQTMAAAARGVAMQQAARRLPYSQDPRARMAYQAMRSIPYVQRSPWAQPSRYY